MPLAGIYPWEAWIPAVVYPHEGAGQTTLSRKEWHNYFSTRVDILDQVSSIGLIRGAPAPHPARGFSIP